MTIIDRILRKISINQISSYKIIEKLGRGGFGIVYKAQKGTSLYAVKILSPALSHNRYVVNAFIREANLQRGLRHPNILPIIETGKYMGRLYIVSEFAEGSDLKTQISQRVRLNQDDALIIMGQIASALEYLHKHSIIHQDLKPANVLFQKQIVKICDFGISGISGTSIKSKLEQFLRVGSAPYMSPEQIKGWSIDERSDIYSFGITSYEMITGMNPFLAVDRNEIKTKHLNFTPTDPCKINPDISKSLSDCIMKMIEKDIQKRFRDVTEILNELSAIAGRSLRTEFEDTSSNIGSIRFKIVKPETFYGEGFLEDITLAGFSFTTLLKTIQRGNKMEVDIRSRDYPNGLRASAEVMLVEKIDVNQYRIRCRFISLSHFEKRTVEKELPGM